MNISVATIKQVVCEHYGVSLLQMDSLRKEQRLVRARHIAMYLARELTNKSLPAIGRCFDDKDHTTVLSACRKIEAISVDPEIKKILDQLTQEITRRCQNVMQIRNTQQDETALN